jgi:hypothetical protein
MVGSHETNKTPTDARKKPAINPSGAVRPAELRKQQRNRQQLVVAGETRKTFWKTNIGPKHAEQRKQPQ